MQKRQILATPKKGLLESFRASTSHLGGAPCLSRWTSTMYIVVKDLPLHTQRICVSFHIHGASTVFLFAWAASPTSSAEVTFRIRRSFRMVQCVFLRCGAVSFHSVQCWLEKLNHWPTEPWGDCPSEISVHTKENDPCVRQNIDFVELRMCRSHLSRRNEKC